MRNQFRRPEPGRTPGSPTPVVLPAIAALLDSLDGEERALHTETAAGTGSDTFARVLDDLAANLTPDVPVLPRRLRRSPYCPAPLGSPGDLVLVIGAAHDAISVVRSMALAAGPADVAIAGTVVDDAMTRVDDRRSAVRARAIGVQNARPVFVAFGLGRGSTIQSGWEDVVYGISPDQVWAAVDAGRKPDDTARWVNQVAAVLAVDAIAVEGSASTATPDTIAELHLPIGWVDGSAPARSTRAAWDRLSEC
ncbi:MAG: hypothetical protein ABWX65_02375 [Mycetocola sp.]